MPPRRIEPRARARALQALYAWDLRAAEPLDRIAEQLWDDLAAGPQERRIGGALLRHVQANIAQIDALLRDATTNWRLERLGAVERCVLRLGVAELMQGETPPRVVIQEGVRLAERFGSEQGALFVNGVLDALARKLGRL